MESKEKPSVWLDLEAAANDNEPVPSDFTKGSGRPVDPRILELARILGRQAAWDFLEQAANDDERDEGISEKRKGKG